MSPKNLKTIFIIITALIYFLFAVFFIYTSDSRGEEGLYFAKIKEVYKIPFSFKNFDAYDYGFLALLFPIKLLYLRFLSEITAFLGVIVLMLVLFRREKIWEGFLAGLLIALNPITIYYFAVQEKWSLLFLGLALFLFIYFDYSFKKNFKNILGVVILAFLSLIETSFFLLLIGFLVFLFLKNKLDLAKPEIKFRPLAIIIFVFLALLFFSFRALNQDLFIESDLPVYLAQYFAVILLSLLVVFSKQATNKKSFLLFILILFCLIEFLIPRFGSHTLFKTAFLPLTALFISLNIGALFKEEKYKKILLPLIIIFLVLSPLAHKKVGENLLFFEETRNSPIKSSLELGELIKMKTEKNAQIFSVYPSFAAEAGRENLPEIRECHADLNYKKRCNEKKQVEILENYLFENRKIDAIIFLEEDIVDYPETRRKIEEKYELSAELPLHVRKMDKALIYLPKKY